MARRIDIKAINGRRIIGWYVTEPDDRRVLLWHDGELVGAFFSSVTLKAIAQKVEEWESSLVS